MNFLSTILLSVFLAFTGFPENSGKNYFKEDYRPQFHFSTEKNWLGPPAGLVYFENEYHLFYQYNPKDNEPGYSHWGHAISNDLIHWQHLPVAINPDENSEDKDKCTLLSGSVIVDQNNTLGKQEGTVPTLVAFYTSKSCGQRIAYSTDKGNTWQKFENNPVLPYNEQDDAQDPKVFWHKESKKWVMVLSSKLSENENSKGVSIYNSDNLIDWEWKSHLPGLSEHPDLVEFKVSNKPDEKIWAMFEADGSFLFGDFDGATFVPTSGKMKNDWGSSYYAPQTWNNISVADGRTLQIAWLRGGTFTGMPFNGQMTLPSELTATKLSSGYKLIRKPVSEIEMLQGKPDSWKNKNLIPGINQNTLKKVSGDCLRITGEFDLKTSDNFGFMIRHSNKSTGVEILYNVKRGVLTFLGSTVPLMPKDNKLKLDIIIDRTSIEIFANDGQAVVSNYFEPDTKSKDVILYTNGGELGIVQLDVYEMSSIWDK